MVKKERGITLVALIVTIILLLIITGVSIRLVTKEDGIIDRAKIAREKYEIAEYQELISIAQAEAHRQDWKEEKTGEEILGTIQQILENGGKFEGAHYEIIEGPKLIITTKEGYKFEVTEEDVKYLETGEEPEKPTDPTKRTIKLEQNPITWTNESIILTGKAQDSENGIVKYGWTNTEVEPNGNTTTEEIGKWIEIANTKEEITKTRNLTTEADNKTWYFWTMNTEGVVENATKKVSNIDTTKPSIFMLSQARVGENAVTLSADFNDAKSGLSQITWYYKRPEDSNWLNNTETYMQMNGENAGQTGNITKTKTLEGLTKGGAISAYAIAYDVAGNEITSYSASNPLTFTTSTYTIAYNANGGNGAPDSQNKYYGVDLTLSSMQPTRAGYTFLGWSKESTAKEEIWKAGDTYQNNENVILYAVWKSEIEPSISLTQDPTNWTNQTVTLTGKAQEPENGIAKYGWTNTGTEPNGNTTTEEIGKWTEITVTTEEITKTRNLTTEADNQEWYFWIMDTKGTVKNVSKPITNIDTTAPKMISITQSQEEWVDLRHIGHGLIKQVTLTGKANDEKSGIVAYQFSIDGSLTVDSGGWQEITATTSEITETQTAIEGQTWYFYAKDQAGNMNKNSIEVSMDHETIEPQISLTQNTNNWTNESVILTGTSQDTGSGIIRYGWTNTATAPNETTTTGEVGKWTEIARTTEQITQTKELTTEADNKTWYFWTMDAEGNINNAAHTVTNIDQTKPSTFTLSKSSVGVNSFVLSANFRDEKSGLSKIIWSYKRPQDSGWTSTTQIYTEMNGTTAGSKVNIIKTKSIEGLSQGGTIKAYAVAYDVAGNEITSYSQSNPLTFTTSTYSITYNANGGSGAPGTQYKYYGVNLRLSSTQPIRTGYRFLGWSTDTSVTNSSSGSTNNPDYSLSGSQNIQILLAGETYTNNTNTVLYAVWKKEGIAEDVTKPTINLAASPTNWTNGNVTLTGTSQDTGSGIVRYGWTNTATTPSGTTSTGEVGKWTEIARTTGQITQTKVLTTEADNKTWYFWTMDAAGNVNNASYAVTNIDQTTPIAFTLSKSSVGVNSFTLSANFNDARSGLSQITWYYKRPQDKDWQSVTDEYSLMNGTGKGAKPGSVTKTKTFDGLSKGGTVMAYARAYDVAGNVIYSYSPSSPLTFTTATYTITYNANGGSWVHYQTVTTQNKFYGVNKLLDVLAPEKEGYTFLGWSTSIIGTDSSSGSGMFSDLLSNGSIYRENADITLYAVWVDRVGPTIRLTPDQRGNANTVVLTGTSQDRASGIVAYGWTDTPTSPSGTTSTGELGKWTEIAKTTGEIQRTLTMTQNGTRYFWTRDALGNINNASCTVTNIVAKVNISAYDNITIVAGNKGTPKLTYTGVAKSKSFTSMNTAKVTVNASTGEVTGVAEGSAQIKVTLTNYDGTTQTKTCTVTVQKAIAKVGTVYYASLANAIAAISSSGTVEMVNDTGSISTVVVPKGKNIILELKDKTITGCIRNEGKLTINGTGTINCNSVGHAIYNYCDNQGSLIISNVTINGLTKKNDSGETSHPVVNKNGSLTIKGNKTKISSAEITALSLATGTTTNIEAGIITCKGDQTITISDGAICNISGGILENAGENSTVYSGLGSTVNITGGTIKNTGKFRAIYCEGHVTINGSGVSVEGGNLASEKAAATVYVADSIDSDGNVSKFTFTKGKITNTTDSTSGCCVHYYGDSSKDKYGTWTK